MPEDRDQLARDLIGCFPVLDKSDRSAAEATDGPTALIAEVERLRGERDREYQRAEGWADQYNRVARQIADLRDERDTALADAKQARADARDSQADAWAEVQRLDALLQTVTAERDRRGDELRRAQAVIDAAKAWRASRIGSWRPADHALVTAVDALEAPVPQPREWAVRHPGIGVLPYDSETEARTAAGTAGTVLHHRDNTWTPA